MKNKFLIAILCLGLLTVNYSCEKDDGVPEKTQTSNSSKITPTITTVSYDNVSAKFNNLKDEFKLDKHMRFQLDSSLQSKSTTDTLGLTIYTDKIKEIVLGDYTSYTMLIETPNTTDGKFYNLTIEDKNGVSGIFITKYVPTEYWKNNRDKPFDGSIISKRGNSLTLLTEAPIDDDGGGGGDVGLTYSFVQDYPTDCDGWVQQTTVFSEYACGCDHWPGDTTCTGCNLAQPRWAGYAFVTTYLCVPDYEGSDPYDGANPNESDPNTGGGTGNGNNDLDEPPVIIIVDPVEKCEDRLNGDLDGNCAIDYYEACKLEKYSDEVCDCVKEGGSIIDCNTGCAQLNALTDAELIKIRLKQLRDSSSFNESVFRIDKNDETGEYQPSAILEDNNGTNHATISTHHQTVAVAHTHPDAVKYKMFSAPDILKMASIAKKIGEFGSSTVQLSNITHFVVFDNKTYALRFDDEIAVQTLLDILNNKRKRKDFKKDLKSDYEKDDSDETDIFKQQEHLFKFLEDYNLDISLYEANLDENGFIDNWEKINKDTRDKEPCN